ncbi:MAG: ParB/RepB/Spo0J family partition protein [Oscillospiraceae bacterium]|nr:ParB/RepB/Spo0J family partition protein [Oscillospiraceae bacterium]
MAERRRMPLLRPEEKVLYLGARPCKQVCWVEIARIAPNPSQPRQAFDPQALAELAASIRQVGLIQPITVRAASPMAYELVSGERRLKACQSLGMTHIDAIVLSAGPEDSALMALIENLQRADLHYLEEAEGYAAAMRRFSLSQAELANRVGRSQPAMANKLRLLRLGEPVRQALRDHGLSERHARALLPLDEAEQLRVARQAIQQDLNVRQTEALVAQALAARRAQITGQRVISLMRDHRLYLNAIRDVVRQMQGAGIAAECTVQNLDDALEVRVRMPRRAPQGERGLPNPPDV